MFYGKAWIYNRGQSVHVPLQGSVGHFLEVHCSDPCLQCPRKKLLVDMGNGDIQKGTPQPRFKIDLAGTRIRVAMFLGFSLMPDEQDARPLLVV